MYQLYSEFLDEPVSETGELTAKYECHRAAVDTAREAKKMDKDRCAADYRML